MACGKQPAYRYTSTFTEGAQAKISCPCGIEVVGDRTESAINQWVGLQNGILRFYREHLTSIDGRFLRRNWERVRQAAEYLISKDGNGDGVIEGAQPNTLDAAWFGKRIR